VLVEEDRIKKRRDCSPFPETVVEVGLLEKLFVVERDRIAKRRDYLPFQERVVDVDPLQKSIFVETSYFSIMVLPNA